MNFALWQIQVKDVLIQSGLHKTLKIRSILMVLPHCHG
ncbi:hypothetical protein Ahy_A04g017906 [Arachis hypogaea]|uniref:Uncharacterized protein n=1 Tax=Arachis hypogaea TaxID=3818 RepID=A0A445DCC7_ARAHY|nr:hypothetical protein Ahy_A04g017906 [Arachis hypogaea]